MTTVEPDDAAPDAQPADEPCYLIGGLLDTMTVAPDPEPEDESAAESNG